MHGLRDTIISSQYVHTYERACNCRAHCEILINSANNVTYICTYLGEHILVARARKIIVYSYVRDVDRENSIFRVLTHPHANVGICTYVCMICTFISRDDKCDRRSRQSGKIPPQTIYEMYVYVCTCLPDRIEFFFLIFSFMYACYFSA